MDPSTKHLFGTFTIQSSYRQQSYLNISYENNDFVHEYVITIDKLASTQTELGKPYIMSIFEDRQRGCDID